MSERSTAGPAPPAHASLGDSLATGWDDPDGALPPPDWGRPRGPRRLATVWAFALFLVALAMGNAWLSDRLTGEAFLAWATVFTAISLQALPFLVFGIALSAALTAFVPASFYQRVMPRNPAAAVPVAGAAGMVLPGCECASVPVASGLIKRGVAPAAALTFLLAAPAINPVVLAATAVAFAGQPEMVVGRLLASFGAAVVVGWIWARLGRTDWLRPPRTHHDPDAPKWQVFRESMLHDLMHAGGFLVVGAIAAATVNVIVPREWVAAVADMPVVSVLVLALFAVVLSVCSEADAFVAVSLTEFSPTAKLAFLVVGPMVDLKLIALQGGTFGWAFVRRFVPLTLGVALVFSFAIGGLLL
ncbi:permease [Streptomonospora nanhaiensis]|uniref:permease n=1 Tax=Streptomonospora nanhaiensis TaxID=1323731 RepID=UPI001C37F00D|nr:permease [Streptomonospora nanhaiensis]MBV2363786.1 permease [Streptomonospora nanhaiensis]MBX9388551.1 permease [Streptomonospora nanhaiensis]